MKRLRPALDRRRDSRVRSCDCPLLMYAAMVASLSAGCLSVTRACAVSRSTPRGWTISPPGGSGEASVIPPGQARPSSPRRCVPAIRQNDRTGGFGAVEIRGGGPLGEARREPTVSRDRWVVRVRGGVALHGGHDRRHRCAPHLELRRLLAHLERMDMRVMKARHEEAAGYVDHPARAGALPCELGARSNAHDLRTRDGDSVRTGHVGEELAVDEHRRRSLGQVVGSFSVSDASRAQARSLAIAMTRSVPSVRESFMGSYSKVAQPRSTEPIS